MIHEMLKRAGLLVPSIRKLHEQRNAAFIEIERLSTKARELERQIASSKPASQSGNDGHVVGIASQTLSVVRTEYSPMLRFGYHLPLDYEMGTVPPRFDPPVWVDGEPLPLPPKADRHGHTSDDASYLEWGKYDHDLILKHVRNALPSTEGIAILDFGCSSGRVLRHFLREFEEEGWSLSGVDISARHIEWLRRHFPLEFQVYTGSSLPNLPFESNSFDVIYGFSVFTHIKFQWDAWLLELRRVLKPGGLLIQTIHTEHAWDFFSQHGHEEWARDSLGPMIIESKELPYDFYYYGDIARSQVFWKRDIAQEFWSRYFTEVTVHPPAERYSYQDCVVAQKPPIAISHGGAGGKGFPAIRKARTILKCDRDFSQNGEQKIILDFFSRLSKPYSRYCVDVGAFDGVIGSNSRALFLNGWRGAVVEPDPKTFTRLQQLYSDRPDITCIQKALSDHARENVVMKFSRGPDDTAEEDKWKYAQVSTLNDAFAASYERNYGYRYESATVTTDTINNVLVEVGAPKDFGFLSIDCEGEDLKILKVMDFASYQPSLICVESDDKTRPYYADVLEPHNYTLHSYTVANAFFRLTHLR